SRWFSDRCASLSTGRQREKTSGRLHSLRKYLSQASGKDTETLSTLQEKQEPDTEAATNSDNPRRDGALLWFARREQRKDGGNHEDAASACARDSKPRSICCSSSLARAGVMPQPQPCTAIIVCGPI